MNTHETNGFAGALALACLMLPIVIRTTDEMLRLVPARAARGQLRARQPQGAHDPHGRAPDAAPGIVSGALLAVARAAGETAPLLFTIGIVDRDQHGACSTAPNTALSVQIFRNASSPFPRPQDRAWGAALTLIVIVFIFTIARPARDRLLRPPAARHDPRGRIRAHRHDTTD